MQMLHSSPISSSVLTDTFTNAELYRCDLFEIGITKLILFFKFISDFYVKIYELS
jgi:hypothetical protein